MILDKMESLQNIVSNHEILQTDNKSCYIALIIIIVIVHMICSHHISRFMIIFSSFWHNYCINTKILRDNTSIHKHYTFKNQKMSRENATNAMNGSKSRCKSAPILLTGRTLTYSNGMISHAQRAQKWATQMDAMGAERMRLAALLMDTLDSIERETGIFLIKPMFSYVSL